VLYVVQFLIKPKHVVQFLIKPKYVVHFLILWKYFYSQAPIFVASTKCIDPLVLEWVISNTTGYNQWEDYISLDFNFHGLSEPRNPQKLEPHD